MVLWTAGVCTSAHINPSECETGKETQSRELLHIQIGTGNLWGRNQAGWWWGRDAENQLPLTSASHIYSDSSHTLHAHKRRYCRSIFIHFFFFLKTCFGACQPVKKGTEAVQFFHHNIQHSTLRLRHAHEYSCSVPSALRQSIFLQYVCDKWLVKSH